MWRTKGKEDAVPDIGFSGESYVVLPVDRRYHMGQPNELRIHVARRGEQVTVLSRHTTDDGPGWVEAKAAT
jgi:hypothetical protein